MRMQSFEHALENMVASVFSRSRSTIRPVELGRRLLRDMDDHRSVDVQGRRIVPNHFTFHLSTRDHASFADIEHALRTELVVAATEYARDEHYHFIGPVGVDLVVDEALKPGRFGIASQFVEGASQAPAPPAAAAGAAAPQAAPPVGSSIASLVQDMPLVAPIVAVAPIMAVDPLPLHVEPAPAPAPQPAPTVAAPIPPRAPERPLNVAPNTGHLVLPSGERVFVGAQVVVIGRLPECGVTLADPNVSRRHAEVRPGSPIVVADLGSTNGTKVNGLRITGEQPLRDGDIISLGSSHLRYEALAPTA